MAPTAIVTFWITFMFISGSTPKCSLPSLGVFDCGDGDCISSDLICDGKFDCVKTKKDEDECENHFRRRCLENEQDSILDVSNFTNFYLGYNIISGLSGPLLDWRYVDPNVNSQLDCKRITYDSENDPSGVKFSRPSRSQLLPTNVDSLVYRTTSKSAEFQSSAFSSPYDAFIDLKKRKSIVISPSITYDDLHHVTLSQAYQQSSSDKGHSYWIDEHEFWQSNSPFVRLYLETVVGEFQLRPNYRLSLNPEFLSDLDNIIRLSNDSKQENDTWWKLFDRYGTHYPISGTIGGSIEVIAKRRHCPNDNSSGHGITMTEIEKCLMAKIQGDDEEEKWHCKLGRRLAVPSLSDAIDWTYRKVIGGDQTLLGPADQLPLLVTLENWTDSVLHHPRALSTDLRAVCDLIDQFLSIDKGDRDEERVGMAKSTCQRSLVDYAKERDVLHVPEEKRAMIPCKKDAVAVWRFVDKRLVLRGLPWCLSTTHADGSCPAAATDSRTLSAAAKTMKREAVPVSEAVPKGLQWSILVSSVISVHFLNLT